VIVLLGLTSAWGYQGKYFFIINWDGMRYDGLDSCTCLPDSLAPEGIFFSHLYNAWHTWTSPGHANIHTGNPQYYPNVGEHNLDLDHYLPSLLEAYVKERGGTPADSIKAWFFGNSNNDKAWGYSRHPGYPDWGGPDSVAIHAARSIHDEVRDSVLWDRYIDSTLNSMQPGLIYIDFHDVDSRGHGIDSLYLDSTLAEYYRAIEIVDRVTYRILHEYIPSKDKYRDSTNVLIISDHGRHTDGVSTGLKDHWCDCEGCRHVMALLWGPDFKDNQTVTDTVYQTDFAHTIAHILGLYAPHARTSRIHSEWLDSLESENLFSPPAAPKPLSADSITSSHPDIAVGKNGRVHVVWCENDRKINHCYKDPNDTLWTHPDSFLAGEGELMKTPKVAVMRDTVAICWERYTQTSPGVFRSWYLDVIYSFDGGQSMQPVQEDVLGKAVLNADLVLGVEATGPYALVGACHTADHDGDPVVFKALTVHKQDSLKGDWIWKDTTVVNVAGIQDVYLEAKDSLSTLAIEAVVVEYPVLVRHGNSEILTLSSDDHGEVWEGPTWVTFDTLSLPGHNFFMNDYYPSCVIVRSGE
jgi:hypothetical protein